MKRIEREYIRKKSRIIIGLKDKEREDVCTTFNVYKII